MYVRPRDVKYDQTQTVSVQSTAATKPSEAEVRPAGTFPALAVVVPDVKIVWGPSPAVIER
jgi:hypothetical protein